MSLPLKCDDCGKFIPYADIEDGKAIRLCISPSSEFSCEEFETMCKEHSEHQKHY